MIEEIKIKNEPLPEIKIEKIKLKALNVELAKQEPIILKEEVLTLSLNESIKLPKP